MIIIVGNGIGNLSSNLGQGTFLPFISISLEKACIMAEGFCFMPLGLVRLRTFWLSEWVT